jgi:hypothetical protein
MNDQTPPPLPAPWSAKDSVKCAACDKPASLAKRATPVGPYAFAQVAQFACQCGSTSFKATLGEGPSPAQFTAEQMHAYAAQRFADGVALGVEQMTADLDAAQAEAARFRWVLNAIPAQISLDCFGRLMTDDEVREAIDDAIRRQAREA